MTSASKSTLILIPGLGDRAGIYKMCKPFWPEYNVRIHPFGWNDTDEGFARLWDKFISYIKDIPANEKIFIVGASAGGVAAVLALSEMPERISRVVTVASPFQMLPNVKNPTLNEALRQAGQILDSKVSARIFSVHGKYDPRVPVNYSKPDGIKNMAIPTIGHSPTIAFALTAASSGIKEFLD